MTDKRSSVEVLTHRGWDVVRLSTELLQVEVVPGKGGDILAVRWCADGTDVLWQTPWGLRHKGAVPTAADSQTAFLENYPGGWQTLFPNGGTETDEQGARLGFHGEATLAPWDWQHVDVAAGVAVELTTCLVRSPFRLRRRIDVLGGRVTVTESFTNEAGTEQEAMWSHHPAFGAPFLDRECTIETGAKTFLADSDYDTPHGDLTPGARSPWPRAQTKDGSEVDLGRVPGSDAGLDRFGYLLDFTEPWYAITNPRLGLTATVRWDLAIFPYAWFWCEAAGTVGFPWYQRAYVLAVEPAASYPGAGLGAARASGTVVHFAPGQTRTAVVSLEIRRSG